MSKCKTKRLVKVFGVTLFSTIILLSANTQVVKSDTNDKSIQNTTEQKADDTTAVNTSATNIDLSGNVTGKDVPITNEKPPLTDKAELDKENNTNQGPVENYPDDAPDTQVIDFPDPVLNSKGRAALNIADGKDITVGDIRNYKSNVSINNLSDTATIANFTGMGSFKYLPDNLKVDLQSNFGNNKVDFSKLQGVNYGILYLRGDFVFQDVTPLAAIPTQTIYQIGLNGSGNYQQNPNGLQNSQLKQLGKWLTDIYNNDVTNFKHIDLGMGSLTDFSPLSGFDKTKDGWLVSLGNYVVDSDPVYIVNKDKNVIDVKPVLGIDGERVDNYNSTFEILDANGKNTKSHLLKKLDNGQYEYDPISMRDGSSYITYGDYGFIYDSNNPNYSYLQIIYGKDNNNGLVFKHDVMNYRKAIRQENPSVTIKYVDEQGNTLKDSTVVNGSKIGDPYDLTEHSQLEGYKLVSPTDLTGNYTQNPQELTFVYKADGDDGGNTGGGNNSGGGSTVDRQIEDSIQYISTFADEPPVDIFDINGNRDITRVLGTNTPWYSDKIMTLNGVKYYRVASGEWFKMADVYVYTPKSGLVRTYQYSTKSGSKTLIDAHTTVLNRALASGTDWIFDRTAEFNGKTYYRVSTNEFVELKDVFEYNNISGTVTTTQQTQLYDETGRTSNRNLASGITFKTDRMAEINNEKYYRVGINEYVKASDVKFTVKNYHW